VSDFWGLIASLPLLRGVLGFMLVFFIPGFCWTLVFFKQLHILERIALSFALSIATITLSILVSNQLLGISITGFNSVMVIIVVTAVPLGLYSLRRLKQRFHRESKIV
jgi:uncharacterized membrane protein